MQNKFVKCIYSWEPYYTSGKEYEVLQDSCSHGLNIMIINNLNQEAWSYAPRFSEPYLKTQSMQQKQYVKRLDYYPANSFMNKNEEYEIISKYNANRDYYELQNSKGELSKGWLVSSFSEPYFKNEDADLQEEISSLKKRLGELEAKVAPTRKFIFESADNISIFTGDKTYWCDASTDIKNLDKTYNTYNDSCSGKYFWRKENAIKWLEEQQRKDNYLFTTNDGIKHYSGDKYCYVEPANNNYCSGIINSCGKDSDGYTKHQKTGRFLYFSTKEAAQKWIDSQKKELFVTNDGVKIYKGMIYWYVFKSNLIAKNNREAQDGDILHADVMRFSTEDAMNRWIDEQKPKEEIIRIGDTNTVVRISKNKILAASQEIRYMYLENLYNNEKIKTSLSGFEVRRDLSTRYLHIGCTKVSLEEINKVITIYNKINN